MIIRLCPPPIYTYPPIHIRQIGGFILEVLSDSPPPPPLHCSGWDDAMRSQGKT